MSDQQVGSGPFSVRCYGGALDGEDALLPPWQPVTDGATIPELFDKNTSAKLETGSYILRNLDGAWFAVASELMVLAEGETHEWTTLIIRTCKECGKLEARRLS